MKATRSTVLALIVVLLLSCTQSASGVVGGAYYAPAYDWGEFFAVTDGRNFQVIVSGNPFPALSEAEMKQRLLPVMQANKPRPNLTFTYASPPEMPHPYYRMVLVFNAANEVAVEAFCAGRITFDQIPAVVARAMRQHQVVLHPSLDQILQADEWARAEVIR